MSLQAEISRSAQKSWAKGGGSHDRLIAVLRVALPAMVGALAAVIVFTPLVNSNEFSFVLDKNKVAVAQNRQSVDSALYRGEDARGRDFVLSAGSAVQKSATEPDVRIADMTARIVLDDGPAQLSADSAIYDPRSDTVAVAGPINFAGSNGYRMSTRNVTADLKARTLRGDGGVSGALPIGRFSAARIFANLETRIVRLSGNARLHINQGALR
ncbi:MAG: LPS export ABC transporter periplasmic protein LptC [Sphingomonadales bacterium]|nr:LPS export ABC transporter periplasmic protein LptC [Sphingomonadales bacterium]